MRSILGAAVVAVRCRGDGCLGRAAGRADTDRRRSVRGRDRFRLRVGLGVRDRAGRPHRSAAESRHEAHPRRKGVLPDRRRRRFSLGRERPDERPLPDRSASSARHKARSGVEVAGAHRDRARQCLGVGLRDRRRRYASTHGLDERSASIAPAATRRDWRLSNGKLWFAFGRGSSLGQLDLSNSNVAQVPLGHRRAGVRRAHRRQHLDDDRRRLRGPHRSADAQRRRRRSSPWNPRRAGGRTRRHDLGRREGAQHDHPHRPGVEHRRRREHCRSRRAVDRRRGGRHVGDELRRLRRVALQRRLVLAFAATGQNDREQRQCQEE